MDLQGSFECCLTDAAAVERMGKLEFEQGVGDALKCLETLPVYKQVRHEMTLLQVWTRAQAAISVVAADRLKHSDRKDQKINEQREQDRNNCSYLIRNLIMYLLIYVFIYLII